MQHSGHYEAQSEEPVTYLYAMLDHLPVGISVVDRELRVRLVNKLFVDMLDFPASFFVPNMPTLEEMTRFNAERGDYGPGDPAQQTQERMARARQGQPHRFVRARPNGRILEIMGEPLPHGGFVTIYRDITEQQRTEQALQENALYLRSIVDHLPQGISVFDDQLRLKCWNDNLRQVLDLPPDSLYPDVSFDELLLYPAKRGEYGPGDPYQQVAQRRVMALQFQAHRFERTRPNGRTHLVEGRPMCIDGRTVGFVTSYTDITEHEAKERELRRQGAVFQTLVDNIPGGVTLFDANMNLLAHNQAYARLLDFPPELFENGPTLERFFRYNLARGEYGDGDPEAMLQQLLERARQNQPHEFKRTRPNGTILEVRGLPLADCEWLSRNAVFWLRGRGFRHWWCLEWGALHAHAWPPGGRAGMGMRSGGGGEPVGHSVEVMAPQALARPRHSCARGLLGVSAMRRGKKPLVLLSGMAL